MRKDASGFSRRPPLGRLIAGVAALAALTVAATALGFGTFRAVKTLPVGGYAYGVAVGDVNGDGKVDIVTSDNANSVLYFRGRGDGTFRPARTLAAGNGPDGVAIGRLNGDRRKDIAVANYNDSSVLLLYQKPDGTFRKGPTLAAGPGAWEVAITDLNRDGRPDLVTGNFSDPSHGVSVILGERNGGFAAHQDYAANGVSYGLAIGRLNADRRPDVVSVNLTGQVSVLLAKSDGTLGAAKLRSATGGNSYDGVAIADFNRDGKADVATVDFDETKVLVFLGRGDGTLKPQIATPTVVSPDGIEAGDFNRDGKPDLAVGVYSSPYGIEILRGKGDAKFAEPALYTGSDPSLYVTTGRLNADRGTDVAVGTASGVDIFLNKRSRLSKRSP